MSDASPPPTRSAGPPVIRSTGGVEPRWGLLLWRGATKRCAHCGGRGIFETWFQMAERCPTCGIRFEREPGFFVGAYLINFAVAIVLLFLTCMGFVAMKAADPAADLTIPLVVGGLVAVVVPPAFYPFSRTIWSAIDIGMTPLEPDELADAARAVEAAPDGGPPGDDGPPRAPRALE